MKLSEVPIGAGAVIRHVALGDAGEGRRLREVGFVPGTTVVVERRAPMGDPTVYQVRATRFALRRAGADLVDVDQVERPQP
ncbi:MAG: ferrous iron transport protein A [Actinobacteria bacterium]|nr:ferrous iron transport protein A [Actinomycetota bacterium]